MDTQEQIDLNFNHADFIEIEDPEAASNFFKLVVSQEIANNKHLDRAD